MTESELDLRSFLSGCERDDFWPEDEAVVRETVEHAHQGNAEAEYKLGIYFLQRGTVHAKDYCETHTDLPNHFYDSYEKKSSQWFKRAAEHGHKYAQYRVGIELYNRIMESCEGNLYRYPIAADNGRLRMALELLTKSAEQGVKEAQYTLAEYYYSVEIDPEVKFESEGLHWLINSAEQGHKDAQLLLANYYYDLRDSSNTPSSDEQAVNWYTKWVNWADNIKDTDESDYVDWSEKDEVYNRLALCYEQGKGCCQSYAESYKWYKKSADQFNTADAHYKIGKFAQLGYVASLNSSAAPYHFKQAVKHRHPGAYYELFKLHGCDKLETPTFEAVSWLKRAAELSHPEAQYAYGMIFEKGYSETTFGFYKKEMEDALDILEGYISSTQKHSDPRLLIVAKDHFMNMLARRKQSVMKADQNLLDYTTWRHKNALYWIAKAAFQSHPEAQLYLSKYYCENMSDYRSKDAYAWAMLADSNGLSEQKDFLESKLSSEQLSCGEERAKDIRLEMDSGQGVRFYEFTL